MSPNFALALMVGSAAALQVDHAVLLGPAAPWPFEGPPSFDWLFCKKPVKLKRLIENLTPDLLAQWLGHFAPEKLAKVFRDLGAVTLGEIFGALDVVALKHLLDKLDEDALRRLTEDLGDLVDTEEIAQLLKAHSEKMALVMEKLSIANLKEMLKDIPRPDVKKMLAVFPQETLKVLAKIIGDALVGLLEALNPKELVQYVLDINAADLVADFARNTSEALEDVLEKLRSDALMEFVGQLDKIPGAVGNFIHSLDAALADRLKQASEITWEKLTVFQLPSGVLKSILKLFF
mmetsp:Transcript_120681/g.341916  ORF Transcript_120681/g.341916 Transcript_120681/m.341916 type:complete len:291 (+) Transcript_120681:70-942(+)